jgi:alpha-tubulin suppressor-like RCC1 family protein
MAKQLLKLLRVTISVLQLIVTISSAYILFSYIFLLEQGNAYSWGKGGSACLGHGDKSTRNNPTEISAFSGSKVLQVFAGPSSAGAITSSS